MMAFIRRLRERWTDYVGDRELEMHIRSKIAASGLPRSTKIRNVRIAAIERPGWVQIYTFAIESQVQGSLDRRWGIARDDGRRSTKVELLTSEVDRDLLYERWAEGMIRSPSRRRRRNSV